MTNETTRKSLLGELLCIADSKWVLGHWYVKVIPNGRTIPDFASMAGMAQDELGHTRALLNYLEQTQELTEGQLEFGRPADKIHNMELLDNAPLDWADFVVTAYLAEQALWSTLEAYIGGSNIPVSNICKKFSEEGYFHRLYVDGWVAAFSEEEKQSAAEAVKSRLPIARKWFDFGDETQREAGARLWSAEECRQHFEEGVQNLAKALAIDLPKTGESSEDWDKVRRRPLGSKMPDRLWEYIVPTSEEAVMARRPLSESVKDNIDLFAKPKVADKTEPFFEQ